MAERPEDLNLPVSVVQRIIKECLPDGVIVSKEARQTICRASSVFVLYLTACAVTHSNKAKRKTLAVNDIFSALNDMEFDSFVAPLNEALKNRKETQTLNKKQKDSKAASTVSAAAAEQDGEEQEDEVEDDEEMNDAKQQEQAVEEDDAPEEEQEQFVSNHMNDENENKSDASDEDHDQSASDQDSD